MQNIRKWREPSVSTLRLNTDYNRTIIRRVTGLRSALGQSWRERCVNERSRRETEKQTDWNSSADTSKDMKSGMNVKASYTLQSQLSRSVNTTKSSNTPFHNTETIHICQRAFHSHTLKYLHNILIITSVSGCESY